MTKGHFPETDQKAALRHRGHSLIPALCREQGNDDVAYYGLSGIMVEDILLWQDVLSHAYIVERPIKDRVQRERFQSKVLFALQTPLSGNVRIVYDDVWHHMASDEFCSFDPFPQVVNLDFCGGFEYSNLEYPKQKVALQNLFRCAREATSSFVLFLTLMPRDRGREKYKNFLSQQRALVEPAVVGSGRSDGVDLLDANVKFHEQSNLRLFKACLPLLIADIGRGEHYRVKQEYVRLYTKMVHLAFTCEFVTGAMALPVAVSSIVETLNAPMRKLETDGTEKLTRPPQIPL